VDVEDERRLKSVVASVSVENELLREKIARLENDRPLAFWKSKPEPHPFAFQSPAVWCGAGSRGLGPGRDPPSTPLADASSSLGNPKSAAPRCIPTRNC
jgi:hypothetical protein